MKVSSHSYLPNNSQFIIIESQAKKNFSPDDQYSVIKTKKKAPFYMIQITTFLNFKLKF